MANPDCLSERSLNLFQQSPVPANMLVYVVDDSEATRQSLSFLLQSAGATAITYASAEAVLEVLPSLRQGCFIIDIRLPGMDGLALQQQLLDRGCRMPVIIVTGHADVDLAVRAMKAGAIDFIEKPYAEADVFGAVQAAVLRTAAVGPALAIEEAAQARIQALSLRERDILRRLVDGHPNKVIAYELGISPRTVEIHRAKLREKLGCSSIAEAIRIAITSGFVVVP